MKRRICALLLLAMLLVPLCAYRENLQESMLRNFLQSGDSYDVTLSQYALLDITDVAIYGEKTIYMDAGTGNDEIRYVR